MSREWYNIPERTKINAFTQVAEDTGLKPYVADIALKIVERNIVKQ